MPRALAYFGQAAVYGLIALLLGYFATDPAYTHFPADKAQIKMSFSHGAERKCRLRTAEELARLAPNMRTAKVCARERLPVEVALDLDGKPLYRATLPPTGLFSDGPSRVYERFEVAPGRHGLALRLRDSARTEKPKPEDGEWDYVSETEIALEPLQNFAIDFQAERGGFIFP